MKYFILSINDDRKSKKDAIHQKMEEFGCPLIEGVQCVDGSRTPPEELELSVEPYLLKGEWGVWGSNYQLLSHINEPTLVFEDDAILKGNFHMDWVENLPEDWDFAAIWVPDNQRIDITYKQVYDSHTGVPREVRDGEKPYEYMIDNPYFAKAYNGYGGVAIAYSKQGANKILSWIKTHKIDQPYDTWLYTSSHLGYLNGYSLKPSKQIVDYDWHKDITQVHNTGRLYE